MLQQGSSTLCEGSGKLNKFPMLHERPGHCCLNSAHHPVLPSRLAQETSFKKEAEIRTPYPLSSKRPPGPIKPLIALYPPHSHEAKPPLWTCSPCSAVQPLLCLHLYHPSSPNPSALCPLGLTTIISRAPPSSASSLKVAIVLLL